MQLLPPSEGRGISKSLLSSQLQDPAALQRSAQQSGCLVPSPHETQFQILVCTSALYGRIYDTAGSLAAGAWEMELSSPASVAQKACNREGVARVLYAPHHHHCHLRQGAHNLPCCPAAGVRDPRPGLDSTVCSLCVLWQTVFHLGAQSVPLSFGDVQTCPNTSPSGYEDQGERIGKALYTDCAPGTLLLFSK